MTGLRSSAAVRYPSYTETAFSWLGCIPDHWLVTYLKYQTQLVNGAPFKPSEWSHQGTPIIRIENLNGIEDFNRYEGRLDPRYEVRKGDLLFAWSGNIGTSFGPYIWRNEGVHYLNQHIFRLDGFSLNKVYFYWLLKAVTSFIESKTSGIIGLVHVTKAELGRIPIPLIGTDEQAGIAAFLDLRTEEIDRFISKKKRLIELFEEQKRAIVSRAVTRGLESDAPMKSSGVEWLGEVPAHWYVKRIKHILRPIDQRSVSGLEPLLSMRMYHGLVRYDEHYERAPQVATLVGYKIVRPGQLVINRMQAGNGLVFASGLSGIVSPDYSVFDVSEDALPEFVAARFRSETARIKFRQESKGLGTGTSGFLRLYDDRLAAIHLALPSRDEQASILRRLGGLVAPIERAIRTAQHEIELIREFRIRLIADVVTGKIDVRRHRDVEASIA